MYYTNRSDGTVTKLISFLLERLIPLLAWLSVLVSFLLQYLIKRYMGLHRDLVHRNRILLTTVLTPTQMNLYQNGVILGIIICILLYIYHSKSNDKNSGYSNRNDILNSKFKRYITRTVLISIGWLLIVFNSESVTTTVTYPLIILSSMFLVFAQYMRIAYIKLKHFISYLKIKRS